MFLRSIRNLKYKKLVILALLVLLVFGGFMILVKNAGAEVGKSWSWTDGDPVVFSSSDAKIGDKSDSCVGSIQIKKVYNDPEKRRMCISSNKNISFGVYPGSDWSTVSSVVGFSFDSSMYRLSNICKNFYSCLYLAESDTLIEKRPIGTGYLYSLTAYRGFMKRLSLNIQYRDDNTTDIYFSFDSSNPDYVFENKTGDQAGVRSIASSKNGKWLFVEYVNSGFGLLNIETLEMRIVSRDALLYWIGSDPEVELAISNDGKHAAIMGQNSGFSLIDTVDGCGYEYVYGVYQPEKMCRKSNYNPASLVLGFNTAYAPRYSDDGGELQFITMTHFSKFNYITLRANGYGGRKLEYLAMGDSYSSGEGETSDSYYQSGTNDPYEKCHLSTRSYPFLIAKSPFSTIDMNQMKSVACSGAVTKDVFNGSTGYVGQQDRLLNFNQDQIISNLQQDALWRFTPGRARQIEFVGRYHPNVITIGIGGNDVGFAEKVKACLMPDICKYAADIDERAKSAREIKDMYSNLVSLYQVMHKESTGSKILAIGYPRIVDPIGSCGLVTGELLKSEERKYIDESVKYLNDVIEAAARTAGIGYINIEDGQGGHILCGDENPTSINFIRTGDDFGVIDNIDWDDRLGQESFHPNPNGHENTANYILNNIGDIASYIYCQDGSVFCPENGDEPQPSNYWSIDASSNETRARYAHFIRDVNKCELKAICKIVLQNMSLFAKSNAQVVINSEPRVLGDFTSADDGSLSAEVKLPDDLEEGYHIVHIYGKSYSGESIDLYQGLKYIKPAKEQGSPISSDINSDVSNTKNSTTVKREDFPNLNFSSGNFIAEMKSNFSNVPIDNFGLVTPSHSKKSNNLAAESPEISSISNIMLYYALGFVALGSVLFVLSKLGARK